MLALPEHDAPRSPLRRMLGASFGQGRRTPRCPPTPRLDGKLAVVTGATGGSGVEIARGLAARGAELILPCRNPAKGSALLDELRATPGAAAEPRRVAMDLEDLESVRRAASEIETSRRFSGMGLRRTRRFATRRSQSRVAVDGCTDRLSASAPTLSSTGNRLSQRCR